jgi:hypothetical protein
MPEIIGIVHAARQSTEGAVEVFGTTLYVERHFSTNALGFDVHVRGGPYDASALSNSVPRARSERLLLDHRVLRRQELAAQLRHRGLVAVLVDLVACRPQRFSSAIRNRRATA